MDYDIHDLLKKMGISQLFEENQLRWHYIDANDPQIGGFADAHFDADKRNLTVDLSHWRKKMDDDECEIEVSDQTNETFQLKARRIGDSDTYRVTQIAFDGNEYEPSNSGMIELGCSIFYARALEISEIMTRQRFKTFDETVSEDSAQRLKQKYAKRREKIKSHFEAKDVIGVIVPFKPRKDAPFQRI